MSDDVCEIYFVLSDDDGSDHVTLQHNMAHSAITNSSLIMKKETAMLSVDTGLVFFQEEDK